MSRAALKHKIERAKKQVRIEDEIERLQREVAKEEKNFKTKYGWDKKDINDDQLKLMRQYPGQEKTRKVRRLVKLLQPLKCHSLLRPHFIQTQAFEAPSVSDKPKLGYKESIKLYIARKNAEKAQTPDNIVENNETDNDNIELIINNSVEPPKSPAPPVESLKNPAPSVEPSKYPAPSVEPRKLIRKEEKDRAALEMNFTHNAWEENPLISKLNKNKWLSHESKTLILQKTLQLNPIGLQHGKKSAQQPSNHIKAVEIPHSGASYNPSYDDHKELSEKVIKKEMEIIHAERRIERQAKTFKKVPERILIAEREKELKEGLTMIKGNEKNEDSDPPSDDEYRGVNPPTKTMYKTQREKNRHKNHLKRLSEVKVRKKQTKQMDDLANLRKLKQAVRVEQLLQEEKEKEKSVKKEREKTRKIKRLGPGIIESIPVAFQSVKDIKGNLRNVTNETIHPMKEKFRSLIIRNMVEPMKRNPNRIRGPKEPKKYEYYMRGKNRNEKYLRNIAIAKSAGKLPGYVYQEKNKKNKKRKHKKPTYDQM